MEENIAQKKPRNAEFSFWKKNCPKKGSKRQRDGGTGGGGVGAGEATFPPDIENCRGKTHPREVLTTGVMEPSTGWTKEEE